MLILVNLFTFDRNELVTDIVSDMELAHTIDQMVDHISFVIFQNNKQVVSVQEEEWVLGDLHLKLLVLTALSNDPAVMDELSAVVEIWVHYQRHEIEEIDHLVELIAHESFLVSVDLWQLVLLPPIVFLFSFRCLVILNKCFIQGLVSVGGCEESNCCSVVDQFQ